jgi:hypothetical protein
MVLDVVRPGAAQQSSCPNAAQQGNAISKSQLHRRLRKSVACLFCVPVFFLAYGNCSVIASW